jgi:predicted NAD/FAD-binding protein
MRLSGAGLLQRQTKALYPDHRLSPRLNEEETRDRSKRLLGAIRYTLKCTILHARSKVMPSE